MAEVTAVH